MDTARSTMLAENALKIPLPTNPNIVWMNSRKRLKISQRSCVEYASMIQPQVKDTVQEVGEVPQDQNNDLTEAGELSDRVIVDSGVTDEVSSSGAHKQISEKLEKEKVVMNRKARL